MTLGIEAFKVAASTLGLRLEAPEMSWWRKYDLAILEGVVDGTRVLVQQGHVANAGRPGMRLYFHAAIDPPLDLGLDVSLRLGMGKQRPILTEQDVPGTPKFDSAYKISVAEPERLRAMYTPALHAALVAWNNKRQWESDSPSKNWFEFWVRDESVIIRLETNYFGFGVGTAVTTDELLSDIRASADLARLVGEAAKLAPPAATLAPHLPAWRAFAASQGLALGESPLRISGSFDGVPFAARAAVAGTPAHYGVELTTPFARPLPFYLRLGPRGRWFEVEQRWAAYPDAWAEWARPHKTGDAVFDDAFRVVTADTDAQTALLSDDVRRALLGLLKSYDHVHMTGDCVSVRTRDMLAPDGFAQILRPLAELEKLVDRALAR